MGERTDSAGSASCVPLLWLTQWEFPNTLLAAQLNKGTNSNLHLWKENQLSLNLMTPFVNIVPEAHIQGSGRPGSADLA